MDKRMEILKAAHVSFEMFGYKATTVEQVAKFTKVGKGTVYNFFATKSSCLKRL